MGASGSVSAKSGKYTPHDEKLQQEIVCKDRLSVNDIKVLCQIEKREENHDPTKIVGYDKIFNTMKEWDDEGGVDCKKLLLVTGDICEREVLQLFLTFCDGKLDAEGFDYFTRQTKLYCKRRLNANKIKEIFDKFSFEVENNGTRFINYSTFRFSVIPEIALEKNEEEGRIINKLCWIDYSTFSQAATGSGKRSMSTVAESPEVSAGKKGTLELKSNAATNIQRIERSRQARRLIDKERELRTTHNSPLSERVRAKLPLLDESISSPPVEDANENGSGSNLASPTRSRLYSHMDIRRATSREFSLKSTTKYSLRTLIQQNKEEDEQKARELPTAEEDEEREPVTVESLQSNLAHIIGEYRHRWDDSAKVNSRYSKSYIQKNDILRRAREREEENRDLCSPASRGADSPSTDKLRVPRDMPSIDSEKAKRVRSLFLRFSPNGEMNVNDFSGFCYATVLIPFEPPIDFTGKEARHMFRKVIAECFDPEANVYTEGVLFGKRVMFKVFWCLLIPEIAKAKKVSSDAIVDFLCTEVTEDGLRRLYSSESGPTVISLLSKTKEMESDCSSFRGKNAADLIG